MSLQQGQLIDLGCNSLANLIECLNSPSPVDSLNFVLLPFLLWIRASWRSEPIFARFSEGPKVNKLAAVNFLSAEPLLQSLWTLDGCCESDLDDFGS